MKKHFNKLIYQELRQMEKSKVSQNLCAFSRNFLKTEQSGGSTHGGKDAHYVYNSPWD